MSAETWSSLGSGRKVHRSFPSRPKMTPKDMVAGVKKLAADWAYDAVSIGYLGPVLHGRVVAEPHNLGRGWVGFDFAEAFGCPVKVVNDAGMQALGTTGAARCFSRAWNRTWLDHDRPP
jgi:predicted NBD/HSP70 family sugar kinase